MDEVEQNYRRERGAKKLPMDETKQAGRQCSDTMRDGRRAWERAAVSSRGERTHLFQALAELATTLAEDAKRYAELSRAPRLFDVAQAATFLDLTVPQLVALHTSNRGPDYRIVDGTKWYVPDDLTRWSVANPKRGVT